MKINKGQIRITPKTRNLLFELKRGRNHLIPYLMNRIRWHLYPRIHHVSNFPDHIDLEISSACNLRCPMCYTITDEFRKKVSIGLMDFGLFKKLIDECAKYKPYSIRISFRGEAFIHPNVFEMIKYAKDAGIKEVSSLTHGGMLDEEKFRKLIAVGLDWLTISFDGIGETYNKIRAPNKYDEQVAKIKRFSEIKKELGTVKPVIKIQSIWPAIANNAEEFYNTFSPIVDQIATNPLIDYSPERAAGAEYIKNFTCPVLWQRLVIGSDGKVLLCVNDEMGSEIVGDVNNESIRDVWHGKKLQKAREIHLRHMGVNELSPCKHCTYPRKTTSTEYKIGERNVSSYEYINWPTEMNRKSTRFSEKE
ncbi:MAG: radical SAM protein [Candidatus Nitrosotenuis sp.]